MADNMTVKMVATLDTKPVKKEYENVRKLLSTNIKMNIDGTGYKEIRKYSDGLNRVITETRVWDNKTKQFKLTAIDTMQKAEKEVKKVAKEIKGVEAETKKTGTAFGGLAGKFIDITKKVAAFGLATNAIGLFTSAIREAKDAVFEFDAALTEYKKVSDLSGDALDAYTQKLGELGEGVARTRWNFLGEYRVNCGNALRAFNTNLWW